MAKIIIAHAATKLASASSLIIASGGVPHDQALAASFWVLQGHANLPSRFEVGQDSASLPASFDGQVSLNLPAEFKVAQDIRDLSARFRILDYPRTISPSTVATAGGTYPIPDTYWRGAFYVHGKHFIVYGNGVGVSYKFSSDEGASWSAPVTVRASLPWPGDTTHMAIHFDGVYLHYAMGWNGYNTSLRYRRGLINPNGSIAWSAAEQVADPADINYLHRKVSITTDSEGYPAIAYLHYSSIAANRHPYVTKSSRNDGIWATEAGHPHQLSATSSDNWETEIISLGSKRLCAAYYITGFYNQIFDGSNWGAEEGPISMSQRNASIAPGPSSSVLLSYDRLADAQFRKRTWGVGWGAEVKVFDDGLQGSSNVIARGLGNTIYIFQFSNWSTLYDNYVIYAVSTDGGATWEGKAGGPVPQVWIDETVDHAKQNWNFSSSYRTWESVLSFIYITKESTPYNIRYAALRFWELEDLPAKFEVGQGSADLKAGFTVRQGFADLAASFDGQVSLNLPAEFISRQPGSQNLLGEFISRKPGSQELPAEFISRKADSGDLAAKFISRQAGSQDLPGEFEIRRSAAQELPGEFDVQRDASQELLAEFIVRQSGSQDLAASFDAQVSLNLPAEFTVRRDGSQELLATFSVQIFTDSEDLLAEFITRRDDSEDLLAKFTVRQPGSQELLGEFISRQPGSQEVLGEFISRQAGSQELGASFDAQVSLNLPAEFTVKHDGSQELFAEFDVRHDSSQELLAELVVRQSGSQDILAEFVSRQLDSQELLGEFVIRRDASQELAAGFISRQADSQDLAASFDAQVSLNLPAEFISRQAGSQELLAEFIVRQPGSQELKSTFQVGQGSTDLFARFTVRRSDTGELSARFAIRLLWPLWTNRYWLNGVVQLDEAKIPDSFLEEIITGVMDDIKTWLIAEEIGQYSGWTNIDVTPRAIRRAATYGTVASLYARNIFGPQDMVVRVAPMDAKIFTSSEAAMEYWEEMMLRVLELYLSGVGLLRIWIDTIDEDPVFTMEDIPLYTWSPDDGP